MIFQKNKLGRKQTIENIVQNDFLTNFRYLGEI